LARSPRHLAEQSHSDQEYEEDLEILELDEEDEDWEPEDSLDSEDDGEPASVEARAKVFKRNLKRITPWKMKDLTIPQYVKLARKLVAEKKMWKQFSNLM
jgi:endopolyphosphatase